MNIPSKPGTFRRAARPASAPVPVGQTDTAAFGPDGTLRLNKHMAQIGLASRREADQWIANGWVKVNGQVAVMGMQVKPDVEITIHPAATGRQSRQVTVLINKPIGLVSGQAEDGHQPAITLVQPPNRWHGDLARWGFNPSQLRGLAPAGRLDIDSTGLLVLTQDGRIARQLIGEDSPIEKEYLVRVAYAGTGKSAITCGTQPTQPFEPLTSINADDPVSTNVQQVFPPEQLALLRCGLRLDDEPLRAAKVDWQNPEQLRFVLTEGKKRQIRRMCELVGLRVTGLKRVRIGHVMLGPLPMGQWRYLAPDERFL